MNHRKTRRPSIPAPARKSSLPLILAAGVAGFLVCLLVVGGGWWISSRHRVASALASNAVANDSRPSVSNGSAVSELQAASAPIANPASASTQAAGLPSSDAPATRVALVQESDKAAEVVPATNDLVPRKLDPNQPSVLGKAGTVDRLDTPAAFPKGMLAFLRGLDLLGGFQTREAIASFSQAIDADKENSDFYTARGAAYVVSEKMQEGLPDLQMALNLNRDNVLASRMTRLAYLMLGDQLKASRFYGHGSTDSVDFLIGEVGVGYGSRTRSRQGRYQQDVRSRQQTAASIQKLRTVASMVATSFQTGDAKSAQALFALGVEQFNSKDFPAARRSFHNVILKNAYDWTGRYYYARSLLETGDPDLARSELTYLLCWKRFLPEAFAARALCAAKQNDLKRARADLETAKQLAPAGVADVESAVAQSQAQTPPAGAEKDAAAWDRLLDIAKTSRSFDELVTPALELRRSVNSRRLRWDETYQDRLHELSSAARAQAGNADRLADVAEFLRDNRDVPGLQVETNGAVHYLRRQTTETARWEIELADQLVDEAVNADAKHARSWAIKSGILLQTYNKLAEAEQAANTAVRFGPKLIAAHMALSDCFKAYAARLRQQAAQLRRPKTGSRSVRVVDQNGRYLRTESQTYLIPPSPEDLARAAECDREAAEYEAKEQVCLNNALAVAKGTKDEPFYQALLLFIKKDFPAARPWLERAVAENPHDPKLRRALSNCLKTLGEEEASIEEFGRAVNLQQTTGEVWLRVAWNKLERNDGKGSRAALLRARDIDPSDARIAAFWAVLAESDSKEGAGADASAGIQAALAQEEARARANQTTFRASANQTNMLSPEDVGLSMMLRLKAAKVVFRDKPEQAAEYYLTNAAAEPRLSEWNLAEGVFSAMLPTPNRDRQHPAAPPPLVSLLKNNRIFAGQALLTAGHAAEAARQFAAAENFANRLPAGGTAYLEFELEPQYVPFRVSSMPIYVKLLNAASLLQGGQRDRARMELQQVRYYLANRSLEQRAMQDDPIPALYARLAPAVGLQ